jgi:hypothetical protein
VAVERSREHAGGGGGVGAGQRGETHAADGLLEV